MRSATTIMLLGILLLAARAEAVEIKVLSAGAVRGVVTEVAKIFVDDTGHSMKGKFGTVGVVREMLAAGEPADVVIATEAAIDELARQGTVVAGTRTDVARTGVGGDVTIYSAGLAARAGAPEPARAFIAFLASPAIQEKFARAGLAYQEALSEPTRIVWSNARDPQLARFQETSAACHAEVDASLPGGSRRADPQRQQAWFNCMKTKGYDPREVSGR
jgi:ABC-type molybdate transport system substrate-binding protein